MMVKRKAAPLKTDCAKSKKWQLRLYVGGRTAVSIRAFENLRRICKEYLAGNCSIEVIDLLQTPRRAVSDQIVAVPTLVRKGAGRVLKMIGDLSDTQKVLAALGVRRQEGPG